MQRLKNDFERGRHAAEKYVAPQEIARADSVLADVSGRNTAYALLLAVLQCEIAQFGLGFLLVWLTNTAPMPIVSSGSGWLSSRVTAAMSVALYSRATFRPIRFVVQIFLFQLMMGYLRQIAPESQPYELRSWLVKTMAVLLTLVMTVRAIDLKVLPGEGVSLLPAEVSEALRSAGLTITRRLQGMTASLHSSRLLRAVMHVVEFDDRVIAFVARAMELASRFWDFISPGMMKLRVMIFK